MREIKKIVVHCAATKPSMNIGVDEIRDWHVNGNGWSDIGYHDVIRRDGSVEAGRPHSIAGAHARYHNKNSIGVCLVGGMKQKGSESEFNFTQNQMMSLFVYIDQMKKKYPGVKIVGHNSLSEKDCPCFNVEAMFNA